MSGLRRDLHKAQIMLDRLPAGSIVKDRHEVLWQLDDDAIYWISEQDIVYSSFQLAQYAPIVAVHRDC